MCSLVQSDTVSNTVSHAPGPHQDLHHGTEGRHGNDRRARLRLPGSNPATGASVDQQIRFQTKAEAKIWARAAEAALDQGQPGRGRPVSFAASWTPMRATGASARLGPKPRALKMLGARLATVKLDAAHSRRPHRVRRRARGRGRRAEHHPAWTCATRHRPAPRLHHGSSADPAQALRRPGGGPWDADAMPIGSPSPTSATGGRPTRSCRPCSRIGAGGLHASSRCPTWSCSPARAVCGCGNPAAGPGRNSTLIGATILITDRKHPGQKRATISSCPYCAARSCWPARSSIPWRSSIASPDSARLIFPYRPASVSTAFTRAVQHLRDRRSALPRPAAPRLLLALRGRYRSNRLPW